MPEVQGLSPAQMKVSYIFLTIGAMTLAFGIYMGLTKDSGSVIAIVLLGSVALFAVALSPFLKLYKFRIFNFAKAPPPAAKTERQPEVTSEVQPEVKTEAQPEVQVEVQPEAKAEAQSVSKAEMQPETKVEAPPAAKAEPKSQAKIDAKTDVAKLMNTPLGELLLAALIKDPESAGRVVAQAISQVEGS